jgi:hypothetical protein
MKYDFAKWYDLNMKIRHTAIFTFYETTSEEQKQEVIARLDEMGRWLTENLGVTKWVVELTPKVCDWMTVDTIINEA